MTNRIRARTHGRRITDCRSHDHRLPCDGMKDHSINKYSSLEAMETLWSTLVFRRHRHGASVPPKALDQCTRACLQLCGCEATLLASVTGQAHWQAPASI